MEIKRILLIIGCLLLTGCSSVEQEPEVTETIQVEVVTIQTLNELEEPEEPLEAAVVEEPIVSEPEKITFRVTAYCSCEKCCGQWALNRPVDEFGNEIVTGAAGERLVSGVSCASTYPFGTEIELDGYGTVVVQDRTAKWIVEKHGENIVDIYIPNHEEAWNFGVKYWEGVIKSES